MNEKKKYQMSPIDIFKFAVNSFGISHSNRKLYMSLILLSVIIHATLRILTNISTAYYADSFPKEYVIFNVCNDWLMYILSLSRTLMFEKHLTKLGPYLNSKMMSNLLYSENPEVYDLVPGQIEYQITEGTKAISKIAREIIIEIIFNLISLIFSLGFLYYRDTSKYGINCIISAVFVICILYIRLEQARKAMVILYHLNSVSFKREKTYVEIIENLAIIKCYGEEKSFLKKYRSRIEDWVVVFFKYRYTMMLTKLLYRFLGVVLSGLSSIFFVYTTSNTNITNIVAFMNVCKSMFSTCSIIGVIYERISESLTQTNDAVKFLKIGRPDFENKKSKQNFKNISNIERDNEIIESNANKDKMYNENESNAKKDKMYNENESNAKKDKMYNEINETYNFTAENIDNRIDDICMNPFDIYVPIDTFYDKIEAKNLTYYVKEHLVFNNVNFVINRGDKIVLYGSNGCGKSSIFKIFMKFVNYSGTITVDGTDLRQLSTPDFRKLITYVPQDTRLFDDSIYANIIFGNNRSYNDVIKLCKELDIHENIMKLENGYNTIVGDLGKNINGGLRQKIFYVRAFLCDTFIYLFDEITNNLDKKSIDKFITYILENFHSDKTVFLICHDQNVISRFSKKYKFQDNNIVLTQE